MLLGVTITSLAQSAGAVQIATVTVGNPGNAAFRSDSGPGAVSYTYRMGKYEVTAGQYAAFLNAVARTDTYGLYNPSMDTDVDPLGCNIKRSGEPGQYSYSVASDWANRPVNYVSWGDAVRFTNWMHNGQPNTGLQDATTTENGSYAINGATSDAALLAHIPRNSEATWVLPNRDEWVKSAYHKNDGVGADYWLYATASDDCPSNALLDPDPGDNATYRPEPGDYTIGAPYWRTEVGAHENSASAYGTFDQAGNVREWLDILALPIIGKSRATAGGSFGHADPGSIWSILWWTTSPSEEFADFGFRVAWVPEPGTLAGLLLGAALLAGGSRRRRFDPHCR